MSLIPAFFQDPSALFWERPSRILDQQFGLTLHPEDLFQPLNLNDRLLTKTPAGYLRRWRSHASENDSGSVLKYDKDQFQANLDVSQFKPEEVSVKVHDNVLTIEGKHEEKQDNHGYISRHFVRRYVLPRNYDSNKIESKLSSDGVLIITAPSVNANNAVEQKEVPVKQTGEPAKQSAGAVEQKK